MSEGIINLAKLKQLEAIFKDMTAGKHINRLNAPGVWAELEREHESYMALFTALGYDYRVDARGFAWLDSSDATNSVSATSRQLALVLMVLFDNQSSEGKQLGQFTEWPINRDLLNNAAEKHKELMKAEAISPDDMLKILVDAAKLGFTAVDGFGGVTLLPSVSRFLDHFEALVEARNEDDEFEDDNTVEIEA